MRGYGERTLSQTTTTQTKSFRYRYNDKDSYIIEDSTQMCERIWREDIITDYDDANQVIQVKIFFLMLQDSTIYCKPSFVCEGFILGTFARIMVLQI